MAELIVVSGPPGAGKSTVAALLADRFATSALVAGDDFFAFLRKGAIAPWLPESHDQNAAVLEAAAAAAGRIASHCDVVYDGVVGPWFLPAFLKGSGREHVHYAMLLPPLQVCLDRVTDRVGHGFDDLGAAEQLWRQFAATTALSSQSRFTDVADAAHLADDIVSRLNSGALRYPASTGS